MHPPYVSTHCGLITVDRRHDAHLVTEGTQAGYQLLDVDGLAVARGSAVVIENLQECADTKGAMPPVTPPPRNQRARPRARNAESPRTSTASRSACCSPGSPPNGCPPDVSSKRC